MDTWALRLNLATDVVGVIQNVLHYQATSAFSDSLKVVTEGLINGWINAVWPKWKLMLPSSVILTSVSAKRVDNTGGPTYSIIVGDGGGVSSGNVGASSLAFDIAYAPAAAPWSSGHSYVGPVPDTFISDDVWQPGAVTAAQNLCNVLSANLPMHPVGSTTFNQVIFSRKTKTARQIGEWLVRPKPTSLNKRLLPYP